MSGELAAERKSLVDAIAGDPVDLNVLDHLPERLVPPAVLVRAGSPYVGEAVTFDERRLNYQAIVVAPAGSNERITDELDELVEKVIGRVLASGFSLSPSSAVEQPASITRNAATYLAAVVNIQSTFTF